jgi:hypothetical protein
MPYRWKYSRQCSNSHYQIIYIVREHKLYPRTSVPHNQRVWSFLKNSLSLSWELLQQRAKPHIRRSGRSRSWLLTLCYRAAESLHFLLSDSTRLIWTSSAFYVDIFFCSKTKSEFHSSSPTSINLYMLYFPNNHNILLQTESLSYIRHQKSSPCLRPSNNTSIRLQTEALSDLPPQLLGCLSTYLVRSSSSSALSSSSHFQTAILHKCSMIPNHNSEPPSRLHAHSVQPS